MPWSTGLCLSSLRSNEGGPSSIDSVYGLLGCSTWTNASSRGCEERKALGDRYTKGLTIENVLGLEWLPHFGACSVESTLVHLAG